MNVQLNGNKIAQNNVQNANALLSTVEGNLDVVQENVSRIRDLTLQAKNGTYSTAERQAMQDEIDERIKEINRINDSATFSSLKLFGKIGQNATAGSLQAVGADFQVGSDAGKTNTITAGEELFQSIEFSALSGIAKLNIVDFDDTQFEQNNVSIDEQNDDTDYDKAIRSLDAAITNITDRKSIIGSAGNRMDSALDTLTTQYENLSSAKSIITDADIASEASNYTQQQILQQVSTSLLAQANQAPSIALSLI